MKSNFTMRHVQRDFHLSSFIIHPLNLHDSALQTCLLELPMFKRVVVLGKASVHDGGLLGAGE